MSTRENIRLIARTPFQKASTLSVRNLKMSIAEVECAYRPKELKQFS